MLADCCVLESKFISSISALLRGDVNVHRSPRLKYDKGICEIKKKTRWAICISAPRASNSVARTNKRSTPGALRNLEIKGRGKNECPILSTYKNPADCERVRGTSSFSIRGHCGEFAVLVLRPAKKRGRLVRHRLMTGAHAGRTT